MSETTQFKLRVREDLKAKLETSAKLRGITANTEAVRRLEESFLKQERMFGSDATDTLLRSFAAAISAVEDYKGSGWEEDKSTATAVHMVLHSLIGRDGAALPRDDEFRRAHQREIATDLICAFLRLGDFDAKTVGKIETLIEAKKSRG